MNRISTIIELREFIQYLENKYDLLNFEIDGVKPWQLKRVKIDYDLGKICGVMDTPHVTISLKDKVLNMFCIFRSSVFFNPFFSKSAEIIIFPHSRVKNVGGENIDIYTHYFVEELQENNKSFIEIENPTLGKHYKSEAPWRFHNDFVLASKKIFAKFIRINNPDDNIIKKVEKEIDNRVGRFDLQNLLINATKEYKVEFFLYNKLLKKIKPKQVYLLVSYGGFGSLIKAAKDLGIEVIEFQHGNFSKYHFGYYFGEGKKQLDYFPDKFYVWNAYWKSLINFPINDDNIIIQGFRFLENKKKSYLEIKRDKNRLVVLSQGVIGEKIAKKILDNWSYFQAFDIKYKLHPGEYSRWKEYESLVNLAEKQNVEIVKDIDLYMLFSSSQYQVGVFSTALSEGVEFGCETILLDLPGIEEMYQFRRVYNVKVI